MHEDNCKKGIELTGGLSLFEATGFSMWPFLKTGEKVAVKEVPLEALKVGDIILYSADNQVVCHRLIKKIKKKEEYLLYARGDNSISFPEPVAEEAYLGKAVSLIKNGKAINLTSKGRCFINLVIVFLAPAVSWGARRIKPYYVKLRKTVKNKM